MSKSLGNGVDPNKLMNVYGADILRLWVATVDYQSDVRISENLIKKVSETYRKIRNTFKFLLGNLADGETFFDYEKDKVTSFNKVSLYMLAALEKTKNQVLDFYDKYDFSNAMSTLINFMTGEVSAFYSSISKDTLYCDKVDSSSRREIQTVMYQIVTTLNALFAPVLCFTMDEVLQTLPGKHAENIILVDMPKRTNDYDESLLKEYESFKACRNDVMKALEDARNNQVIGSGQEADVKVFFKNEEDRKLFSSFTSIDLRNIFIVSNVELVSSSSGQEFERCYVEVTHHSGCKCERCWNYFSSVFEVEEVKVCARCKEVIDNA